HDITSMQHAGLWQSATLRTTGPAAIRPGGIIIQPDATTGEVTITIDLHDTLQGAPSARAIVEVEPPRSGSHPAATAAATQRTGTQPGEGDPSRAARAAARSGRAGGSRPLSAPAPRRGGGSVARNTVGRGTEAIQDTRATLGLTIPSPQLWSPDAPNL